MVWCLFSQRRESKVPCFRIGKFWQVLLLWSWSWSSSSSIAPRYCIKTRKLSKADKAWSWRPQKLGWRSFSLPYLFPWPPIDSHASLKGVYKNASSSQINPDIKGRHEGEPKSKNQRHWLIFSAPSTLLGGPQAPWGELHVSPPAHPQATPSLWQPFSRHIISS